MRVGPGVIGLQVVRLDVVVGKPSQCVRDEVGDGGGVFVGVDLGVGEVGVVVDD